MKTVNKIACGLFATFHRPAEFNMQFDLLMMDNLESSRKKRYWRIYSWEPAAVSVGRNQEISKVLNLERLAQDRIKIVRRPTGGRAIYHKRDICISTAGLIDGSQSSGSTAKMIYLKFAEMVKVFFKSLDLGVDLGRGSRFDQRHREVIGKLPCFLSATPYELTVSGKKIAGIASWVGRDRYLIQSSLRIGKHDLDDFAYFPGLENSGTLSLKVTSLEEETGMLPSENRMLETLAKVLKSDPTLDLFCLHEGELIWS